MKGNSTEKQFNSNSMQLHFTIRAPKTPSTIIHNHNEQHIFDPPFQEKEHLFSYIPLIGSTTSKTQTKKKIKGRRKSKRAMSNIDAYITK